ncbi:MAG: serine hydrolase [Bradyrhizobiaceae bacterium]|nr:serine hydrolase [Bradyrhizobiaceae bacterium]
MQRCFVVLASTLVMMLSAYDAAAQRYFPSKSDTVWQTVSRQDLGWCDQHLDTLYRYLAANNTRAFLVLKDGKMAIEWYPDSLSKANVWFWASAGKTLTSVLVGLAQQDGALRITDATSKYLGNGWTSLTPEQEQEITIWHQLTMTSGLDDAKSGGHCTTPDCLVYKAKPGTRWAYHNAPYTLLDAVIKGATGKTINQYLMEKLKTVTGMDGLYVKLDDDNVMFSTPRSMARFGLLALNNFVWDGTPVLWDTTYIRGMLTPSQDLNRSYGYLWWLNGKASYMLPTIQLVIPGPLSKHAPSDAVNGLGKNDQILCVVPSENLVVIRLGDNATTTSADVATVFYDEMWALLRQVICTPSSVEEAVSAERTTPMDSEIPLGSTVYAVNTAGELLTICNASEHYSPSMLPADAIVTHKTIVRTSATTQTVYLLMLGSNHW